MQHMMLIGQYLSKQFVILIIGFKKFEFKFNGILVYIAYTHVHWLM